MITERQELLRESNKIHDKLKSLWFTVSVMSDLPSDYSFEEIEKVLIKINELTNRDIEIWKKRARLNRGKD